MFLRGERGVAVRELTLFALKSWFTPPTLALTTLSANRDAFAIDLGLGNLQPERVRVLDLPRDLTHVQKRLGRDAAPIQADAADLVAVEAHDFFPSCPKRIAA